MSERVPWVVISGGAETVALSLLESAWSSGTTCHVLSLRPDSLLAGLPGVASFSCLAVGNADIESTAARLLSALRSLRGVEGRELAALPSEDDGLRLLNLLAPSLQGIARFSRCAGLRAGGLDKAELFEALAGAGLRELIAPTLALSSPAGFDRALEQLGEDAVFKPAAKPWARNLDARGMKTVHRRDAGEPLAEVRRRLERAWTDGERWVAQQRLASYRGAETSACIVAGRDAVAGCQVREKLKFPRGGGSAVWVSSTRDTELLPAAAAIARAVGLRGLAEMTFLADADGAPRLIELNTRPWLQVELVQRSGFPIVQASVDALFDEAPQGVPVHVQPRDWLQIERLLLAVASGDAAPRAATLARILREVRKPIFAVYSTRLPGARRRWIARMLKRVLVTPGAVRALS